MPKQRRFTFHHLRTRLLVQYTCACVLILSLFSAILYTFTWQTITDMTNQAMTNQLQLLKNLTQTHFTTSLKSHFKAGAEALLAEVSYFHDLEIQGKLTRQNAQALAKELVGSHRYGQNGYAAIMDKAGTILAHLYPEYLGKSIVKEEIGKLILTKGDGFKQYAWTNPGDSQPRAKSLYSICFDPWGWYLTATGYDDEFMDFVSIEDLEQALSPLGFGKHGYAVVFDFQGVMLVHPSFKGVSMLNRTDSMGDVIRTSIKNRNGRIEYLWKNPGDPDYRRKFSIYAEVPQFHVIVGATAYESEVYEPLVRLGLYILGGLAAMIAALFLASLKISKSIADPILALKELMDQVAQGNLDLRAPLGRNDEVGAMAGRFNHLLDNLQNTQAKLMDEERSSTSGRIVAKLAQQLSSPIGTEVTTVSYLQGLLGEAPPFKTLSPAEVESFSKGLAILVRSQQALVQIIESFQRIQSGSGTPQSTVIHLEGFLIYCKEKLWAGSLPPQVELLIHCPPELKIRVLADTLQKVLDELVDNAVCHAFPDGRSGTITLDCHGNDQGIEILCKDDGVGIPGTLISQVFEPKPQYSPESARSGLGLAMVYSMVTVILDGNISLEQSDSGTLFRIQLPQKTRLI